MSFINQYNDQGNEGVYVYSETFAELRAIPVIYSAGCRNGNALVTKTDDQGSIIWEKYYVFEGANSEIKFDKIVQLRNDRGGIILSPTTTVDTAGGISVFTPGNAVEKNDSQSAAQNFTNTGNDENPEGSNALEYISGIANIGSDDLGTEDFGRLGSWYVLHATDNENHWLIGIDGSGKILWCFLYKPDINHVQILLEPCLRDGGFYAVISATEYGTGMLPIAAKFTSSGVLASSQQLAYSGFDMIVKTAHSNPKSLIIGTVYLDEGNELGDLFSCIFQLDENLGLNDFAVFDLSLDLHDVTVGAGGDYLLNAKWSIDDNIYGADFSRGDQIAFMIPDSMGYTGKFCLLNDDYYYLLQYNEDRNYIHKIAYGSFDIAWSKSIPPESALNGIKYLTHSEQFESLSFTEHPADGSTNSVIFTDEELNSCRTIETPVPVVLYNSKYLAREKVPDITEYKMRISKARCDIEETEAEKEATCGDDEGDTVDYDENTLLQSPAMALQAAGSTGDDGSAKGIHLRWIFGGGLGEKHLPKADYATTNYYFNKPDDYVKIYRTPYYKVTNLLDLSTQPYLIDDGNKVWMYRVDHKVFYVYFRNHAKYNIVRALLAPANGTLAFISTYGNELLEIENKRELFFAASVRVEAGGTSANIKVETLSVGENALAVPKTVSSRKTYSFAQLGNINLLCDNGRSIRMKPSACFVQKIYFEFYSDFIVSANERRAWHYIDKYALTLKSSTAFSRLEPADGIVDGRWPRFNDEEFVKARNYQDKWSGPTEAWDRNIVGVVKAYIELSDGPDNPTAIEEIPLESEDPSDDDSLEVSNLSLINIASYDYHIARMLGLGTLDLSHSVFHGRYIYVAQYYTKTDLQNGGGDALINLVSMSLPVSISNERLPLAVNLSELRPGAFFGSDSPEPVNLTDINGYTPDGMARYVTIFSEPLPEDDTEKPFFISNREFDASQFTYPVYAGLEYKKNDEANWVKPELPNDLRYQNITGGVGQETNETIPINIPEDLNPLFVHKERVSGTHYYSSYGINWFSRTLRSNIILSIESTLTATNPLKPPINIQCLLIREESPLLMTSHDEQVRFSLTTGSPDRTLIRMTFDYHSYHELIDYPVPEGASPSDPEIVPDDALEVKADEVEIFFRKEIPTSVSGKAVFIYDDPVNMILSIADTGSYTESSTGTVLQPVIGAAQVQNFIGGLFIMGDQQFIIHAIELPTGTMSGPRFSLYKHEISSGIITNEIPSPGAQNLESPVIIPDGLFMAVENMQNRSNWGTPNPLSVKVKIGELTPWEWAHETITINNSDGTSEQHVEKARGIWDDAFVEAIAEPTNSGANQQQGLYKFSFESKALGQHHQYQAFGNSIEWYGGIVRVHTTGAPNDTRKTLKVIRLENIGTHPLILYAYDESFDPLNTADQILTGSTNVNFYPGYKVYLYTDNTAGLNYNNILPAQGEGVHYSIFGLRSHATPENFYSKLSTPQLLYAQELVEAAPPLAPQGSLYATRPDFFGRSTYTLKTTYSHKPYGVLYYRSNDELLLNSLYKPETVIAIRENLKGLGGNEESFLANRWQNFLDFAGLTSYGDYQTYPPVDPQNPQPTYKFPNPDKQELFDWANYILEKLQLPLITGLPGSLPAGNAQLLNFVKGAIYNAFVPLTEVPILYNYINTGNYQPANRKQVIRNRNGNVLEPGSPEFDMAPMMKITGQPGFETIFADFTLDGISNNLYFYGAKEMDTQMKMSDFSPFLGPVKLVNTNPPEAPQIKRIMPVLENSAIGISPAIQFELNSYPPVQRIKKINVYRSTNALDAHSVQLMDPVKTIDLNAAGIIDDGIWQFTDDFSDLDEIPYSDPLYYRLTAAREVEYDDKDGNVITEFAPSQPSKITATLIVENYNPPAPVVTYTAGAPDTQGNIDNVTLHWAKSAYKAKYHIYKMNNSGNWVKINTLSSNLPALSVPLADTDLASNILATKDAEGNNIYSHFKVVAENTSGMLSLEENILTIPG